MAGTDKATGRAWYAVGVLGALYIIAFLDRVILALLVEPIRREFGVSDTEMSLLIGFNFAVFYALVGIPMGRLADRTNRRNLILITTAVWAACTLFSGMASTFWMLCLLRVGVAIGEAALSPSAISMIGDLFPAAQRGRATSIYMSLGALGATGGYMLGGWMVGAIEHYDVIVLPLLGAFAPWQTVFLLAATPAAGLAILAFFTLAEPKRVAGHSADSHAISGAWLKPEWRPLLFLFIAGATGQTIVRGLIAWTPTYLHRAFEWPVSKAGVVMGLITTICGVGGMLFWPAMTERWLRRGRSHAVTSVLIGGMFIGAALTVVAALMPTAESYLAVFGASMFLLMGTGVLLMVSIQIYGPASGRGEFMAVCLLTTVLIADGIGPTIVPVAAQMFGGAAAPLNIGFLAAALAGPIACVFALLARPGLAGLRDRAA